MKEKNHISILGTCCSRNLFETIPLKDCFEVDKYGFQICLWDLFSEGLNIAKETVYKSKVEDFTARMFWYELSKATIKEIENAHSEYLMIDLDNIWGAVYKIELNDKIIYSQSTRNRILALREDINQGHINELKELKFTKIENSDMDKSLVKQGLKNLADWALTHFDEKKIIINKIKLASDYFSISNQFKRYIDTRQIEINKTNGIIAEFEEYLESLLPNAIILNDDSPIAAYGLFDSLENSAPDIDHYSYLSYYKKSMQLIEKTNLELKEYFSKPVSPLEYALLVEYNKSLISNANYKNLSTYIVNLNTYIDKIENLDDVIILISAYDECSNYLKYFRRKAVLGLQMNVGFRQAYIAVVDKSRNFVHEQASPDKISYNYSINDTLINLQSAGYNAGNNSIIKIGENNENLSPQKRGLNIVILNSKTLDVIDIASCDSYDDKNLTIFSNYFNNVKLKV